jgi:hypothetical protein
VQEMRTTAAVYREGLAEIVKQATALAVLSGLPTGRVLADAQIMLDAPQDSENREDAVVRIAARDAEITRLLKMIARIHSDLESIDEYCDEAFRGC